MALVSETSRPLIDLEQIAEGDLLYAKHRSWPDGRGGIVTDVRPERLTIQFHPELGNVMNHFFIPASEIADKQWEIRWSRDMQEVREENVEGE